MEGFESTSGNVNNALTETFTYYHQFYIKIDNGGHGSPSQVSQWVSKGSASLTSVTSPADLVSGNSQWVTSSTTLSISNVQAAQSLTFTWTEQFYLTVASAHGFQLAQAGIT